VSPVSSAFEETWDPSKPNAPYAQPLNPTVSIAAISRLTAPLLSSTKGPQLSTANV
jgi:hypothetical protein